MTANQHRRTDAFTPRRASLQNMRTNNAEPSARNYTESHAPLNEKPFGYSRKNTNKTPNPLHGVTATSKRGPTPDGFIPPPMAGVQ